jgi:hypothetical protein
LETAARSSVVVDTCSPLPFVPSQHGIEIRNNDFRYSPDQALLFEGFSFGLNLETR